MSQRPSINEAMDNDDALINSWMNYTSYGRLSTSPNIFDEFEAYMDANGLYERVVITPQILPLTSRTTGSGLSQEKISEHLRVMKRTQEKVDGKCEGGEEDSCAICLSEYEENDMIGIIECGHQFHAACIKGWLVCKNVCPLCRDTALTV